MDESGCSIACLAMITNRSYFSTREVLHQKVARLKNRFVEPMWIGLYAKELLEILTKLFKRPCREIEFTSLKKLKKHCILIVHISGQPIERTHSMIFDAKRRCIIDPLSQYDNLDNCSVRHCLEME